MQSWNRAHDWVVQRFYNDLSRMTICFESGAPTIGELVAVRRCLPQFRNTPPAEVRASVGRAAALHLDAMATREAFRLAEVVRAAGLKVLLENASFISYLPYDRTTGCAWLIEDDAEARSVAEAMIAAGVPIQNAEA